MAKKIDVQKEPVKLREKVLKNGSISLFLDIYSNGRRHKYNPQNEAFRLF